MMSCGNPSNLFFAFIRLAAALAQWPAAAGARLRVAGAPHAPFNLVPLEYVADATLALAEHPDAAGGTFHLVVRDAPRQSLMSDMLAERLGLAPGDPIVASFKATQIRLLPRAD